MVIVALCVAALCLTLGFAAFSNTLTISSSATVTPEEADFKIVNEGKYTAYMTKDTLKKIFDVNSSLVCTPDEGTSAEMVQNICNNKGIEIIMDMYGTYDGSYFNFLSQFDYEMPDYIEIPVG